MNAETKTPETLIEAVRYFTDLDVAHQFFAEVRWPDGQVSCPHCGSINVNYLAKYRRWECREKHDRRQFTVKVGTVMEDSPLGLDKWAVAFWLEMNAKNSISSYELHRALGITQKSAWFMLHRIRLALQTKSFGKVGGGNSAGIEADETFIGGKAGNMHRAKRAHLRGTGGIDKAVVIGVLDRSIVENDGGRKKVKRYSKVIASVIAKPNMETLHATIHKHVEKGAELFTDANQNYNGLTGEYLHQIVDHAQKYVDGRVHTNGIENFWSLFKRAIKGSHVSVEPFHLQAYLDSEIFRFNNRELKDGGRFALGLQGMTGKRLTYKQLTATLEVAPGSDRDAGSANAAN